MTSFLSAFKKDSAPTLGFEPASQSPKEPETFRYGNELYFHVSKRWERNWKEKYYYIYP